MSTWMLKIHKGVQKGTQVGVNLSQKGVNLILEEKNARWSVETMERNGTSRRIGRLLRSQVMEYRTWTNQQISP